jgi:histidine triad (HIT) family protein
LTLPTNSATEGCAFCAIAAGALAADIVYRDELTLAFVDLRQFHPGHILVIPLCHFSDVRALDDVTGAALMATVSLITRAVGEVFPNEGLSLWHSIGEAAFQEVPHLHFHIHPRFKEDGLLRIYPTAPDIPEQSKRDEYATALRHFLRRRELKCR